MDNQSSQSIEHENKIKLINYFTGVGATSFIVFGALHIFQGTVLTGVIEISLATVGIINALLLIKTQNTKIAGVVILLIMLLGLSNILLTGGIQNTGILWFFTFPALAFFLRGRNEGTIWVCALLAICAFMIGISFTGTYTIPYSFVFLRQFFASFIVVSLLVYFYEKQNQKHKDLAESRTQQLVKSNQTLEEKINENEQIRTSLEENNTDLVDTKAAVLNLLEDLDAEKEKLKELDKLKDDFVSIASHELRTPMGAIKAFVAMILAGDYGKVSENLKEPLADIKTSTERLVNLVNDLLNVARIEAGRMRFVLTDSYVADVVNVVVKELAPLAKEKKLKLELVDTRKEKTLVQLDPDKVKQVITNLIGNSLKFTDKGGITVSIENVEEGVEINVSDTGLGISKEDQGKLFNKFQQAKVAGDRPAGTGLGLYISREIIRKMGGELWIKNSEVGKGSAFAFTLPASNSKKANEIKQAIQKEAELHPDQK